MSIQCLPQKSFAAVGIAVAAVAHGAEPGWWIGGGTMLPQVRETAADYGADAEFSRSQVTFPQIAAERRGELVHLQFGYRKLGALHFESADRLTRGHTHSNALQLTARVPAHALGGPPWLHALVGVNAVRTIAGFDRRAVDFAITGGVNRWTWSPSLGLGAELVLGGSWVARLELEGLTRTLGETAGSGRYRQQWFGLQILWPI